jgi:hypothetical protein
MGKIHQVQSRRNFSHRQKQRLKIRPLQQAHGAALNDFLRLLDIFLHFRSEKSLIDWKILTKVTKSSEQKQVLNLSENLF